MADLACAARIVAASDSLDTTRADYVCDGTADEVQINQAISDLNVGGGLVVLLDGTFNLNAQVDLVSNLAIIGNGYSTHVKPNANCAFGFAGNADAHILVARIFFDGVLGMGGAGHRGLLDFSNGCSDIEVNNCYFENSADSAVYGARFAMSSEFRLAACRFAALNNELRTRECDNFIIEGNKFASCANSSIGLCCSHHAHIIGNVISGIQSYRGPIWIGAYYRDAYDILIQGNVTDITDSSDALCGGVHFIGNGGNGWDVHNVRIEGNIFRVTDTNCIMNSEALAAGDGDLIDIVIENNSFVDGRRGIYLRNQTAGGSHSLVVRNNQYINLSVQDILIQDDFYVQYGPEVMEAWVTKDVVNPSLHTMPANSYVKCVHCHVTEAFNAGGADDAITVGYDADVDAFATSIDVTSTGIKTVTAGAEAGFEPNARAVEAYYTYTGAVPTTGKAIIKVEYQRAPAQP